MGLRNLRPDLNGTIVIDKPVGWTSTDVCSLIRRRTGKAKVGHGGTLDPLASGVLVVCLGRATKTIPVIMDGEKEYDAAFDLSAWSPSDDRETEPQRIEIATPPTRAEIENLLASRFIGEIEQTPPTYSAIQVGGKRAYDAARRGAPMELKSRIVTIHQITVISYDWPILRLHIRCGKGVYIRSIARDLGRDLTGGGMLIALRRTRVGRFSLADAIPAAELPERIEADSLIPMEPAGPPAPE